MSNVVPFIYSDNAVLCYSWHFIRYLHLQEPVQHGAPIQQEAPKQQEVIWALLKKSTLTVKGFLHQDKSHYIYSLRLHQERIISAKIKLNRRQLFQKLILVYTYCFFIFPVMLNVNKTNNE